MAKILLVDDEPDIAELMSDWLRLRGYDVLRAGDGLETLRLARTARPDLILLDSLMPGLDGVETCRRLRAQPETRHLPVILVASEDAVETQVERLMAGASDAVTRPLALDDLGARISALLAGMLKPEDRAGTLARQALEMAVAALPCRLAWLFAPDGVGGGWVSRAVNAPGQVAVIPSDPGKVRIPADDPLGWSARALHTQIAEINLPVADIHPPSGDPILETCRKAGATTVTLIPLHLAGAPPGLLLLACELPLDVASESVRRALLGASGLASLALEAAWEPSTPRPAETEPAPPEESPASPPPAGEAAPPAEAPAPEPPAAQPVPGEAAQPVDLRAGLEALREATLAALTAHSPDAALQTILSQTTKALQARIAVLLLRTERGGSRLIIQRAVGMRARRLENVSIPLAGSLAGEAMEGRGTALRNQGAAALHEAGAIESLTGLIVETMAAAALTIDGEPAGALLAMHRSQGTFSPEEGDLLQSLANLAALAITVARLAGAVRQRPTGPERADQAKRPALEAVYGKIIPAGEESVVAELVPVDTEADKPLPILKPERRDLQRVMASLNGVAQTALNAARPAAGRAGITLGASLGQFLPDVFIDREQIAFVIQQLLRAAISASPPGGRVSLAVRDAGPLLQVEVAGQSSGEPALDEATRHIIEQHGGNLWVERRPDEAVLAFTLPKTEITGMGDFIPSF